MGEPFVTEIHDYRRHVGDGSSQVVVQSCNSRAIVFELRLTSLEGCRMIIMESDSSGAVG